MRWVVGLELRGLCGGATSWSLALTEGSPKDHQLYGVHLTARSDAVALAQRALHEYASDCGATDRFEDLRAAEAGDVGEALIDACEAFEADGLILGRQAPRDGSGWARLGEIARRIIRSPPCPVFVVAPDFTPAHLGAGPILAASNLRPDSVDACRFATKTAALLQREVHLLYVAPSVAAWSTGPLGPGDLGKIDTDARAEAHTAAEQFITDHALDIATIQVLQGDPIDELLRYTIESDPIALTIGSRRLSTLARLFSASVGTELAGSAPCPVAVVPPTD